MEWGIGLSHEAPIHCGYLSGHISNSSKRAIVAVKEVKRLREDLKITQQEDFVHKGFFVG